MSPSKTNGINSSSMPDRDLSVPVDKIGQRHASQMAWINKRPTISVTAHRSRLDLGDRAETRRHAELTGTRDGPPRKRQAI
ncbi:MAG: hypothetical protein WBV28_01355 [Terracidiphilus sp.]